MFKVLVVEDDEVFYQDYLLRLFAKSLPMEQLQFTHVPNIERALEKMIELWDVILMDYALGSAFKVEQTGSIFRDGKDLITLRRQLESSRPPDSADGETMPASFIIGTSSNQVGNRLMVEAGANVSLLKIQVVEMAREIWSRLENHAG